MPRPRIDLDAFRDEIEHRITLGRSRLLECGPIISGLSIKIIALWPPIVYNTIFSLESLNSRNERFLRNGYILMLMEREVNGVSTMSLSREQRHAWKESLHPLGVVSVEIIDLPAKTVYLLLFSRKCCQCRRSFHVLSHLHQ